ncbi:(Fe-S)-binding protein [Nocardioides sp. GXZ039]|uniref:(Fe-S)-binding protein n=1 Tax=Nocardioides sp. GXZ039 TaxID=3136018 RepID=UPI0030F46C3B
MQIVAIVIALALTLVTVVAVVVAVRKMVGVIKQGQRSMNRHQEPARRTVTMLKETFLHTRMLQWHWVGMMHWFVYAGFLILSSAVLTGYFQLFDPEFALPLIGHFYLFEWVCEAIGLLSTVGIVFLIVYRQMYKPSKLGRRSRFFGSNMGQAYFVEAMALLEGSAILFIRGAEYNLGQTTEHADQFTRGHFPISSYVGDLLYPSGAGSRDSLENIIILIALFKIVLAMVWLLVIARNLTMGVAWHRFTAWPNIWFKRDASGRTALGAVKPLTYEGVAITLDDIDELDEDTPLGVGAVDDFAWKGILDFTTCTECGRCQSQCPAWNTEKPLSPKLLMTALRNNAYEKAAGEESAEARTLIGKAEEGEWFYNPEGGDFVIDADALWACTTCGACVQQCPVDIEHVDHVVDMRRYQVLVESNFPAELNGLFKGLENKGNPWNMSGTARMDWAKGLDFEVPVVGDSIESLDEVDWLFWVGCAGAYEDRAKKTTRAVAELLDLAGVSFGVLGNGETCTGDPARRAGNEFVFQGLVAQNVETFQEYRVKKVVSTCAHCFNTLKNEYKHFGVELEVVHHTQLLNRLVREGKLTPVRDGAGSHERKITYHDPCYIGRHNNIYTPPRELLEVLPGADFVEMPRHGKRSFCCGAGGARMWMEENIGERINIDRTKEAVATGADQIAVGCPFCRVMLSDGLTAEQAKGEAREEVEVLDVAQMLLASVKGQQATKLAPGAGAAAPAKAAPDAAPDAAPAAAPTATATVVEETEVVEEAPAAPAPAPGSGGSLFDDGGSMFDEPAAPAKPAGDSPAGSGGSLFDAGEPEAPAKQAEPAASGGSLFDVAADEPTDGPEKAATPEKSDVDLSGGGSLFDLAEPEAAPAPAPQTTSAPAAPASSAPAPAAEIPEGGSLFDLAAPEPTPAAPSTPAPEPEAPAAASPTPAAKPAAAPAPTAEIPEGGSLFDLAAPEPTPAAPSTPAPEPAAQPEAPAAATPTPAAKPAAAPAPTTEIPEGGSLFDIAAPEPAQAASAPAAPQPDTSTPASPEPTTPDAETPPQAPSKPATDTTARTPGEATGTSTGAAPVPATAIPEGGSLFDIAAPEPSAPKADEPVGTTAETAAAPEPHVETETVTATETEEAEPEPAAEAPSSPSGKAAHQPRTDVEIGEGSLFDL